MPRKLASYCHMVVNKLLNLSASNFYEQQVEKVPTNFHGPQLKFKELIYAVCLTNNKYFKNHDETVLMWKFHFSFSSMVSLLSFFIRGQKPCFQAQRGNGSVTPVK